MFNLRVLDDNDKELFYANLLNQTYELLDNKNSNISNFANMASLLWHHLQDINWVGFYLVSDDKLILGPFHGKPACTNINIGSGVCGTSIEKRKTILVDNVHEFPGHIACDSDSNSEIVIPIIADGVAIGLLDIDSPKLYRFDEVDKKYLEEIIEVLKRHINYNNCILSKNMV